MKKLILSLTATILASNFCFSQDVITKKSGEDIQAKVLEITNTEIKYKKFDNPTGPIFTMSKTELLMIRYENGSKDIFTEIQSVTPTSNPTSSTTPIGDLADRGKEDANSYYRGDKSGAGWVAATAILASPLLGVIPAVICANVEPSDDNLNYKEPELMKNAIYNQAYTEQAHKIKKKRIWRSYGISAGIGFVLNLLLLSY